MAKTEKKPRTYLTREIPGVVSLFLAVITFLALISYHSADPSFMTHSTSWASQSNTNYVGLFGAYSSSILIVLFGLASLWVVFVFLLLSARFFGAVLLHRPG